MVPNDIMKAQTSLAAKLQVACSARSKTMKETSARFGDLVEVYMSTEKGKRGMCSSPHLVVEFDPKYWTVTVPEGTGKDMQRAIEDIEPALSENQFASVVREAKDLLDSK